MPAATLLEAPIDDGSIRRAMAELNVKLSAWSAALTRAQPIRGAAIRLPAFAEGRLVRSWSGLYDTTPDWNPVLGPVPGIAGLQVAFGFSGHGFKLAPMVGRMLAQSMLGQKPDLPLHPYRFSRFAEGRQLVGTYGSGSIS